MFYTFTVTFKDEQELDMMDFNKFDDPQIKEINGIASQYTETHIKALKYGFDIEAIEQHHKETILDRKNDIVYSLSSKELYDEKIVKISTHSIGRTFQRVGTIGRSTYIGLIDRIKKTDSVIKAQWKGYPQLSYTFIEEGDPEEFKFPLSFLLRRSGDHRIKVVTVVNVEDDRESEPMENRLFENPRLAESFAKMEKLFKKG
jgi:hypothetical protein